MGIREMGFNKRQRGTGLYVRQADRSGRVLIRRGILREINREEGRFWYFIFWVRVLEPFWVVWGGESGSFIREKTRQETGGKTQTT